MVPRVLAACLLATSLVGQTPAPGFATTSVLRETGALANLSNVTASRDGRTLYFSHQHLLYATDAAGTPRIVAWLPPGEWIGCLFVDPRDDRVWLTNSVTDALLTFTPQTGVLAPAGSAPHLTFALALDPISGTLLSSANPTWPNPGAATGIWAVDPAQGRHRELIRLSGPSGPLALSPAGDLWYATQLDSFPPPPGSTDLLRATRVQMATVLAGGAALRTADLQLVTRGLDGGYDLALDGQGHAYLSDSHRGHVQRIDLASGRVDPVPVLHTGAIATTDLTFVAGRGPAPFAAFQPAGGGTLLVTLPDWNAIRTEVVRLQPARPDATVWPALPVPRGPARVALSGAVPNAACVLFLSPLAPVSEYEALRLGGLPVWAGLDPAFPWLAWPAASDASGNATFAFQHAGGVGSPVSAQALCLDAAARQGTAPVLVITFLP